MTTKITDETRCPCGSGDTYQACCGRFHAGEAAPTSEALMRSRYSAYALSSTDPDKFAQYVYDTWAPETRPDLEDLRTPGLDWDRLTILSTTAGGPFDSEGTVEFVAQYHNDHGKRFQMHEVSDFRRENKRWFYVDGEVSE
ncbi:YchJ family protein [Neomicrococcus lactis]|uniref:YchJ family protein n=1 Tax=Neomicrococcus lactis TaxID=732241 RepID=UPI00230111F5|nr:YchJ family protein [Neomicrococcus lactis]